MTYYKLRCRTCSLNFLPVLCTEKGDLLCPDYAASEETAGFGNTERLRDFHAEHAGHELVEVVDSIRREFPSASQNPAPGTQEESQQKRNL